MIIERFLTVYGKCSKSRFDEIFLPEMEPPPGPAPTVLAALERFSIEVEDEVVVAPATGVKWEKRRTCEPPLSGLAYLGIP